MVKNAHDAKGSVNPKRVILFAAEVNLPKAIIRRQVVASGENSNPKTVFAPKPRPGIQKMESAPKVGGTFVPKPPPRRLAHKKIAVKADALSEARVDSARGNESQNSAEKPSIGGLLEEGALKAPLEVTDIGVSHSNLSIAQEVLAVLQRIAEALELAKPVLNKEEAARLLGGQVDTLVRFNRHELPARKSLGRGRIYLPDDITGFLRKN